MIKVWPRVNHNNYSVMRFEDRCDAMNYISEILDDKIIIDHKSKIAGCFEHVQFTLISGTIYAFSIKTAQTA